ncbi:heavy metal tolerance protein [Purpureocillium lavendulum]|uniref:Heavy metal tolerance protein n=1 Tax=Purpureocillium lavendulum TaxID=1247861 RepID=A0AB34G251_9HYPO|nr:heavy metal tolerance protein [Purpureocillium lavendulum]
MKVTIFSLFVASVAGNISLLAFKDAGCPGDPFDHVESQAGNPEQNSGCIPVGDYKSVNIANADSGFKCNLYSDTSCNNFIKSVSDRVCDSTEGQGVECFAQAEFDNPFFETTARVTIGKSSINTDINPDQWIRDAVSSGCADRGCDPNTPFTSVFDHFLKKCEQHGSASGSFDSTDERDYMTNVLATAMQTFMTNIKQDGANEVVDASGNPTNLVLTFDIPSFAQIVIVDNSGAIKAQLAISLSTDKCTSGIDVCSGIVGTVASSALEAVPVVGGVASATFDIICDATGQD